MVIAPSPSYHLATEWRVEGTCGEIADVFSDPLQLVRWWPSVYLSVDELEPAGADGGGRRFRLRTKGWLPYTLQWDMVVVEQYYPNRLTLEASGDVRGRGTWTFVQDGPRVKVFYDWRVTVEKPLLRALSPLLKPVFEANHRWAMAQGRESLALEVRRRRTLDAERRAAIPPPPGPVTYAGVALVGSAVLGTAAAAMLIVRASRRTRRRRRASGRRQGT